MSVLGPVAMVLAIPVVVFIGAKLLVSGVGALSSAPEAAGGIGLRYPIFFGSLTILYTVYRTVETLSRGLFSPAALGDVFGFLLLFTLAGTVSVRALDRGFSLGDRERSVGPGRSRQFLVTGLAVFGVGTVLTGGRFLRGFFEQPWQFEYAFVFPLCLLLWIGVRGTVIHPARAARQVPVQADEPTDEQRARLESCLDTLDVELDDIYVHERGWNIGYARYIESGDSRTLLVSPDLFDIVDDEGLAVVLTQAVGQGRQHYERLHFAGSFLRVAIPIQYLMLLAVAIPVLTTLVRLDLVAVFFLAVLMIGITMGSIPVFAVLSRRATRTGDQFASNRLGSEAVRRTYERYGEALSTERTFIREVSDRLDYLLHAEPPMERRLRQLGG